MLLSYTVDLGRDREKRKWGRNTILVDEAFRYVYNDDTIDFDHLDRFDFAKMSKALIHAVNVRVKGDVAGRRRRAGIHLRRDRGHPRAAVRRERQYGRC